MIAICFHGIELNKWENSKSSFVNNILDAIFPIVHDIFIHTFDNCGFSSNEIDQMMTFTLTNSQIIKPKLIVIENLASVNTQNQILYDPLLQYSYGDPELTKSLFTEVKKIYDAYESIKQYQTNNNIQYQYIMMTRFNCIYETPLNISLLPREDTIYTYYTTEPDPCDKIVIGKPKSIEIYISRYNEIFTCAQNLLPQMGVCPTSDNFLLLRYCCIKNFGADWTWTNIGYASLIL